MITITVTELQKQSSKLLDMARLEPVSVTHHGREDLVVMSINECNRLKSIEDEMNKNMIERRVAVHRDTLEKLAKV